MKQLIAFIFSFAAISLTSCDIGGGGGCTPPPPPPGHIQATINGKVTMFAGPVTDSSNLSFIASHEIHMRFMDGASKYVSWSLDINGIDVANLKFPYTITGPITGGIVFGTNILDADPTHSPYGKVLAGLNANAAATVTILSIDGNSVKGTFSGTGVQGSSPASFTNGEFFATLKRVND